MTGKRLRFRNGRPVDDTDCDHGDASEYVAFARCPFCGAWLE
jgi:hypothetical protein